MADFSDKAKAYKREFDPKLRHLAVEFSQRVKTLLIKFHHNFGHRNIEIILTEIFDRLKALRKIRYDIKLMFRDWVDEEYGLQL